jgi:arsenate reductase
MQVDDLAEEFHGFVSRETVERVVTESVESLGHVRIDDYVPVLAYRFSHERLEAIGQAEGGLVKEVPEVLFVCVENAGRSQMAAALLDHRAEGRVHVRSAGSDPADQVNPNVVEAMSELGIDITREFPKPMTDEVVRAADAVITMSCGDACPGYPGKMYRDWELDDPKGKSIEEVRRIRDDIDARVRGLLRELVG